MALLELHVDVGKCVFAVVAQAHEVVVDANNPKHDNYHNGNDDNGWCHNLIVFDEFMNDLSNVDCHMEYNDHAIGAMSSAERKHVCTKPGCNKSYTSSHGLKYHIAHGHSKEKENAYKPFSCPVANCGKTYRNSNGLKYHMSKIHKHP